PPPARGGDGGPGGAPPGAGRAPPAGGGARAPGPPPHFSGREKMPQTGWDTVTVPGGVAGWKALSDRFGKLPFATLFEPAIEYAENGFLVSPRIARQWALQEPVLKDQPGFAQAFLPDGKAPQAGQLWRFPAQAATLRKIAESGGDSFYRGELAARIVAFAQETGGALRADDLEDHCVDWVEPISQDFGGYTLHELPPNGQGIAALIGLGILNQFDVANMGVDSTEFYHVSIEAMKLAFADLHRHVSDPRTMRCTPAELLDPGYLKERAALIAMDRVLMPSAGAPKSQGTVYMTAADANGSMVSLIQSNYRGFGSGIVVPGTGIALHNRGEGFNLKPGHVNCVGSRKRPMHTIIPGFVTRHGKPAMSFGVMGGSMQAQGHVQMMTRFAAFGQNPQAMSDAPRFRVEHGPVVHVEQHMPARVLEGLRALGHHVQVGERDSLEFGSAQIIYRAQSGYIAASDSRRDGQAVGF
ncbi:gamma-glutamyltransferase family protein, partial [Cupriavidus sp. AU9028]|uniref:gamma-glutamyltransferase family protein n=1 Tax=Cupriavidus sp. AU9028 TaxID=2871157 RepID=UPI001C93DCAD|nr:gamma-glutamyltransferase family protein [Cupriavidus sp. AU9028]